MAIIGNNVNKLKFFGMFLLLALVGAGLSRPAGAAEPFVVGPVERPEQVRLLPAGAWPPPESDQGEMLIKLSYLRGIMDALQYVQVAPQSASRVLEAFKGMSLNDLAAAVDRYYLADPRRRDLPPAAVVFRILPQSQGQIEHSPLPGRAPAGKNN